VLSKPITPKSMQMSLSSGLSTGGRNIFTYVTTDRALDLGNLAPFTILDLSGNANTATLNTGIYVSTNGTIDKAIRANATALGSGNYYLSGKIKPAGTTAKTTMNGSTASNLTGLTAGVWQDFQTATASAITPSSINLGWDGTAFNTTVDNWSDVKLHDASDDSVVAHYKLYDSADASLDGYPALDCVGGYHGAHVGCAGGSGEETILQTAGEDFNMGYPLSNDLTVGWIEAGVGVIVDSDTFTTPVSAAGVYLTIKTGITYNYKVSGTTTGSFQIWDWGGGGAVLKNIVAGAFSVEGTFTSAGASQQFYLRAQSGAIQVDLTELNLEIADFHVAESETTAGQDALGNAIENPRPNERVLNLTTGTGYATVADNDSLDLGTSSLVTHEFWIKIEDGSVNYRIIDKFSSVNGIGLQYISSISSIRVTIKTQSNSASTWDGATDIADGQWHHIIVRLNNRRATPVAGDVSLLIDGADDSATLFTSASNLNATLTNAEQLYIGFSNDFPTQKLVGQIGDVRQYDRALTADEVLKNYNARKGAYGL
jgi:hypothetical protein